MSCDTRPASLPPSPVALSATSPYAEAADGSRRESGTDARSEPEPRAANSAGSEGLEAAVVEAAVVEAAVEVAVVEVAIEVIDDATDESEVTDALRVSPERWTCKACHAAAFASERAASRRSRAACRSRSAPTTARLSASRAATDVVLRCRMLCLGASVAVLARSRIAQRLMEPTSSPGPCRGSPPVSAVGASPMPRRLDASAVAARIIAFTLADSASSPGQRRIASCLPPRRATLCRRCTRAPEVVLAREETRAS